MVYMYREKKTGMAEECPTESERCGLVLNGVFYWESMEIFQKRCELFGGGEEGDRSC